MSSDKFICELFDRDVSSLIQETINMSTHADKMFLALKVISKYKLHKELKSKFCPICKRYINDPDVICEYCIQVALNVD